MHKLGFIDINTLKIYGVYALSDTFEKLVGPSPKIINTAILPYGDKIIYDGFLRLVNLDMHNAMYKEFSHLVKDARANKKVITKFKKIF